MKNLEFSGHSPNGPFQVLATWTEEETPENWAVLVRWIHETQVWGFFRLTDSPCRPHGACQQNGQCWAHSDWDDG